MNSCVFCKINAGKLPESWLYRDDAVVALLDFQPVNEGHTLLIPTEHAPNIADLEEVITARLFSVARQITKALYETLGCDGVNWFVADGEAADQKVSHFHLHLIPRCHHDGFGLRFPEGYAQLPTREALDHTARAIRDLVER